MKYSGCFVFLFFLLLNHQTYSQNKAVDSVENGLQYVNQLIDGKNPIFTIQERMAYYNVPGVSVAVVNGGELKWAKGYGIRRNRDSARVYTRTLFQAGSISKPVAAVGILKLVDEGRLNLDRDIRIYLNNVWDFPKPKYAKYDSITIRQLLSHTAGVTVHGFMGYTKGEKVPDLMKVLSGQGNSDPVEIFRTPGEVWRYSGGGYEVLQLIVEQVTGKPFATYMSEAVLDPLDMKNSTYNQPIERNRMSDCSHAFNLYGDEIPGEWNTYPELAAAGLWTTPTDLAKFLIEIQQISEGKQDGILSESLVDQMLHPGLNNWGLGFSLNEDGTIFGHGGKNVGFTNKMRAFVQGGDAIIVMTNGDKGSRLIDEIILSVSTVYDMEMVRPNPVRSYHFSLEDLNIEQWVGYWHHTALNENAPPTIYTVEIKVENDQLVLYNPQEKRTYVLTPLGSDWVISLAEGHQLKIKKKKLTLNNSITFKKAK